jgi:hypothetical protein
MGLTPVFFRTPILGENQGPEIGNGGAVANRMIPT